MSISASEARKRLFPLVAEVNDDAAAVEIVSKAGSAFLVPAAEYRSLVETSYLLSNPVNAEWLRESIEQARQGRAEPHELLDPEASPTAESGPLAS
ncbi:type II toxin-antitoxin system Phd/YefM family antitoxin [Angustibacter aerolatus]